MNLKSRIARLESEQAIPSPVNFDLKERVKRAKEMKAAALERLGIKDDSSAEEDALYKKLYQENLEAAGIELGGPNTYLAERITAAKKAKEQILQARKE